MTMCTSCAGDQIWSHPIRFEILNLLLSKTLLVARMHIASHTILAVDSDVFVLIAFRANNSLYARSPDTFSFKTEGAGTRDYLANHMPLSWSMSQA